MIQVNRRLPIGITLTGVLLLGIFGCEKKEKNELISLNGRVEKVQRITDTSGEITVRFFNEKQNKDMVGTALVTPETRIEKSGQPATFADVQEGLKVNGQVRSFKKDGQREYQAVLIQIESSPAVTAP